jgi:hypothetical protein
MVEWFGDAEFDPEEFDLDDINERLISCYAKKMKLQTWG